MPLVINLKQTDTGLVCRSENTKRFYNDIRKFDVPTKEEETKMFIFPYMSHMRLSF